MLHEFCKLGVDRYNFLLKLLQKLDIPYTVLEIESARHIILYPENLLSGNPLLIAHYDRVDGTPGANDNSASVYFLIKHGIKLRNINHSTSIILTDREEIRGKESVKKQGAFGLGKYMKSRNIEPQIYIFDMCGIGTTLLLGTGGEGLIKDKYGSRYKSSSIYKKIEESKGRAEEILLSTNYGEFFYLTPLFSDDLGLILNGYPSTLISLLPYREAIEYKECNKTLPKSWRCNHTMDDSIETLDNRSESVILPLLERISGVYSEKRTAKEFSRGEYRCYTQKVKKKSYAIPRSINYYIEDCPIDTDNISSGNQKRVEIFKLLISRCKPSVIEFYAFMIENPTGDIYHDLYYMLKELIKKDFMLLPVGLRSGIIRLLNCEGEEDILDRIFSRVVENIRDSFKIESKPLGEKLLLNYKIVNSGGNSFVYTLKRQETKLGEIELEVVDERVILTAGNFIPGELLNFDPLNLLKALRTTLIKWAILNNNKSLEANLNNSNWLGCYQLFNLLKMELHGRSNTIWRNYWEQR